MQTIRRFSIAYIFQPLQSCKRFLAFPNTYIFS